MFPRQDTIIYGNCDECSGVRLLNIEVDGSRPSLGWMSNGAALVELGGTISGQLVDSCHFHDPRGWSCFHLIGECLCTPYKAESDTSYSLTEGNDDLCTSSTVSNNLVGPSGEAPNTATQYTVVMEDFKEFMTTPPRLIAERDYQAPGQW